MNASQGELHNKVAIVTGASRGIGREIALTLGRSGAKLVVASRNKYGGLEEVAEEIRGMGTSALAIPAHMGKSEDISNLVEKTLHEFKRIDILVNNAGINTAIAPILEMEEQAWDHIMNVNLKGIFLLSQKVARVMIEQKGGCIINISSVYGIRVEPGFVAYSASKAGLIMLTQGLAKELGQYGIRVNAVAPGLIPTKTSEAIWSSEEVRAAGIKKTCIGRLGTVEEVANVVLFLASNMASYVTGTTIVVDGGKLTS